MPEGSEKENNATLLSSKSHTLKMITFMVPPRDPLVGGPQAITRLFQGTVSGPMLGFTAATGVRAYIVVVRARPITWQTPVPEAFLDPG